MQREHLVVDVIGVLFGTKQIVSEQSFGHEQVQANQHRQETRKCKRHSHADQIHHADAFVIKCKQPSRNPFGVR